MSIERARGGGAAVTHNGTLGECQHAGNPAAAVARCAQRAANDSTAAVDRVLASAFDLMTEVIEGAGSVRAALERARAHAGSGIGWRRVLARLEAGKSVVVGVLGGSMSLPGTAQHPNWPERLREWMQRTWPRARVSLHNGAIGATGSSFFAVCAETRLPERVDLVVLEHALNDGEHQPVVDATSLRGRVLVYEVLVRRLLLRSHPPALLFLSWDRIGWCANLEASPRYTARFLGGPQRGVPWLATPQIAVDVVARWYGLPSLAPRNALWHKDCDDLAFRGTFCDSYNLVGCGHLKPLGAALVARVLTSFLLDGAKELTTARSARAMTRTAAGGADGADGALPPPLLAAVADLQVGRQGGCLRGAGLLNVSHRVLSGSWEYVRRDPNQPLKVDKPGLLSLRAPSTLEVEVPWPPARTIAVGFLRSYDERMGDLRVACTRGCACNTTILGGRHRQRSSVMAIGWLPVRPSDVAMPRRAVEGGGSIEPPLPATCTLRVTHISVAALGGAAKRVGGAQMESGANGGSKAKLLALMTPAFALNPSDFKELEKAP